MSDATPESVAEVKAPGRSRLRLRDCSALILGYGLAAVLLRAYWPRTVLPTGWPLLAFALQYAWLGLAMSGPALLLRREHRGNWATSWAENAWIGIGAYWTGLLLLALPIRLPFAITPMAMAFAGWVVLFSLWRLRRPGPRPLPTWTHRAALWLLGTWPLSWLLLIYLAGTLD